MLKYIPTVAAVNGVKTTHYNLIDSIRVFMSAERWHRVCDLFDAYVKGDIRQDQWSGVFIESELQAIYRNELDVTQAVAAVLAECVTFSYVMDYGFMTSAQASEIVYQMILDEREEQFGAKS